MKRLTWLVGFTIIAMALPFSAYAGDGKQKQEKREKKVEVRVERRDGGDHDRQRRRQRGDGHDDRRSEWRGQEQGDHGQMWRRWAERMHEGGNWQGMHERARHMFRGIHDRAMNIHFQPQVEDSQVAVGIGNKNITADTINLNISIGDIVIDGNEVQGGEAGEMLEMVMELMMKGSGHLQHGGPGPWHERIDGNRPPMPDMPPHEDARSDSRSSAEEALRLWLGEAETPDNADVMIMEYLGVEPAPENAQHLLMEHFGIEQTPADAERMIYEYLMEGDSQDNAVAPGEVRSPYHDFYFGDGELPRRSVVIHENTQHPQPELSFWHEADPDFHGGRDLRPEIMDLAMQIPDEVPADYVAMLLRLGQLAWEDDLLRERLEMLLEEHELEREVHSHVDREEIQRLIEQKLRSKADQAQD